MLLGQSDILRRIYFGAGVIHLEKVSAGHMHYYMIYKNCGIGYGFHHPESQAFLRQPCEKSNFVISDYCFQIFGICSDCRRREIKREWDVRNKNV
ncbi:MAG: hypothetical protein DRP26_00345 [Candidatus Zixiibacteriota bacterium]|nr:MAG: hypothetical protein DRP26_00345 [candidate division Zixibacteria bacterium]